MTSFAADSSVFFPRCRDTHISCYLLLKNSPMEKAKNAKEKPPLLPNKTCDFGSVEHWSCLDVFTPTLRSNHPHTPTTHQLLGPSSTELTGWWIPETAPKY